MKSPKIVVYTAIADNYDRLTNLSVVDPAIDYICFSDAPFWLRLTTNTHWQIRKFPYRESDPIKRNRRIKLLSQQYLSDYDVSIYIDGNIDIIGNIDSLLARHKSFRMLAFSHPLRQCIYAEGAACIAEGKGNPQMITKQLESYAQQGHPEDFGLIEANVLIRRHSDETVARVMEAWWQELIRWSQRDQLGFPFVARRYGFWPTLMNRESARGTSPFFILKKDVGHRRRDVDIWQRIRSLLDAHILWRLRRDRGSPQPIDKSVK